MLVQHRATLYGTCCMRFSGHHVTQCCIRLVNPAQHVPTWSRQCCMQHDAYVGQVVRRQIEISKIWKSPVSQVFGHHQLLSRRLSRMMPMELNKTAQQTKGPDSRKWGYFEPEICPLATRRGPALTQRPTATPCSIICCLEQLRKDRESLPWNHATGCDATPQDLPPRLAFSSLYTRARPRMSDSDGGMDVLEFQQMSSVLYKSWISSMFALSAKKS